MGNRYTYTKFQENLFRSNEIISIFCPSLFRKRPIQRFCCPSTFANIFFCKDTLLIVAIFYMQLLLVHGTQVFLDVLVHITNMAAIPILSKTLVKIFPRTFRLITLKLCMQHRRLGPYKRYSNDDIALTLI